MTTLQEVLERLARVEANRLTTDVVFQTHEHTGVGYSRRTFVVNYELGPVQKLGGRVIVELREVDRRQA